MVDIKKTDHIPLGIILVLGSTLLVAIQDSVMKGASSSMSLWQIYVLRSIILIPLFLIFGMLYEEGKATFRNSFRLWPMVRSGCFIIMYFTMYSVIQYVPLSVIAAGIYTAPLFVVIISFATGIEPLNFRCGFAVIIGFLGVLFTLKPDTDNFNWLTIVPIFGGLFYALVGIVTRSKCHNISPATLSISLNLMILAVGVVGSIVILIWGSQSATDLNSVFLAANWTGMGYKQWGIIIVLVVLMFGNGLLLPTAYQVAPTTIIATFDYFYLIFATLIGLLIFSEVPNIFSIIGMFLIAFGGLLIIRSN